VDYHLLISVKIVGDPDKFRTDVPITLECSYSPDLQEKNIVLPLSECPPGFLKMDVDHWEFFTDIPGRKNIPDL
jgi:hypothetical protein